MSYLLIILILIAGGVIGLFVSRIYYARSQQITHMDIDVNDAIKLALDISGNHVMRFDLKKNSVYDLNGRAIFGNNVTMEDCYTYIHDDDLPAFRSMVERMSQGKERESSIRYRWNFNYTGHGEPDWHYMRMLTIAEYADDSSRPSGLIATIVDETEQIRKQKEEYRLSEVYKTVFENSIVGLSFYTPEGQLMNSNALMRQICHFDSVDYDAFYSNANLFDVAPFPEVLDRNNVKEVYFCTLSIVPEREMYVYLEVHVHPIKDENGQLVYIAVAVRDITPERDMYLQAKQNDEEIKRANAEIQIYETELNYLMERCELQAWRINLAENRIDFYRGLEVVERSFTLEELRGIFVDQDDFFVQTLKDAKTMFARPQSHMALMHPVVSRRYTEPQWAQINSIPEYDEEGNLKGAFGLWRNVTRYMKKQDELRRETERANDSGRMKSVFLANMTHEIRTPLNAIVGFSDLLQAVESKEDKREMIRVIHNNCDMLLRLVNDILELSNVDANAMQIRPVETDFARFFDDVCQSLAQRISEPDVMFKKDNPYTSLMVSIDQNRIQQIITNFVTNAVKYTHRGHIRVGYRLEMRNVGDEKMRNGLYVYCEDTGEGIPEDQKERVFERFVKLNDYIQGTGLGLSICKAIIEKCNGVIGVDSKEGHGSNFWFWIPVTCYNQVQRS